LGVHRIDEAVAFNDPVTLYLGCLTYDCEITFEVSSAPGECATLAVRLRRASFGTARYGAQTALNEYAAELGIGKLTATPLFGTNQDRNKPVQTEMTLNSDAERRDILGERLSCFIRLRKNSVLG
jgi:hypothetical protein